jgi:hypothetical protein
MLLRRKTPHREAVATAEKASNDCGGLGRSTAIKISETEPGSVCDLKASPDVADVSVLRADSCSEGLQDQRADLIGKWQLTTQCLSVETP